MKIVKRISILFVLISLFSVLNACINNTDDDLNSLVLEQQEKDALLYMLEEEKLARDTYTYLDSKYSNTPFGNIKKSEQSHMNAIENLLIKANENPTILPSGVFANQDLQNLYNQLTTEGSLSLIKALQVGATIEDLDIVDLEKYKATTTNTSILNVFNSLQCASRNHLRSFVSAIANIGGSYTPQFLTQTEYNAILAGNQEQCN